jgi:hypothetical protein
MYSALRKVGAIIFMTCYSWLYFVLENRNGTRRPLEEARIPGWALSILHGSAYQISLFLPTYCRWSRRLCPCSFQLRTRARPYYPIDYQFWSGCHPGPCYQTINGASRCDKRKCKCCRRTRNPCSNARQRCYGFFLLHLVISVFLMISLGLMLMGNFPWVECPAEQSLRAGA